METSKKEVFSKVQQVLVELFELEESSIVPQARLYEDLDIDSIDAVEMMIELKKFSSKKITPEQFKHVKTLQDFVDVLVDTPTDGVEVL